MSAGGADVAVPGELIEFAGRLADAVRPIALRYFRQPVDVAAKDDDSPVTIADQKAETAMRALIEETYPDHGILGEEHGGVRTDAAYLWVLDPIDGTQSFVTGKPLFGTLIALLKDGVPILGVMDMPALDERWIGARGQTTTYNGAPVKVRPCTDLKQAWIYATSPHMFPEGDFEAFEALRKQCRRTIYGAECYAYGLLANGQVDLVVESTMQPYDFCALVPIVEGAGGMITDWAGGALKLETDGRVAAAGDAGLHEKAINVLKT
ncbi:MAG: histidinol-phosphatase [Rhodospirillales bacterium]|nr:histidinol-phosphatase [Rhodospirillales bacterium]